LTFCGVRVDRRNIKFDFPEETNRASGKLRTAKDAGQLLEELRTGYQSLAPEEQREVKEFMSDLLETQRRFGSAVKTKCWLDAS
jgi:hypothetical protein